MFVIYEIATARELGEGGVSSFTILSFFKKCNTNRDEGQPTEQERRV